MLTTTGCLPVFSSGTASRIISAAAKKFTSMIGRKRRDRRRQSGRARQRQRCSQECRVRPIRSRAASSARPAHCRIGHVAHYSHRAPAQLANLHRHFREPILAPRDEHEIDACAAQTQSPAPARSRLRHR